MTSLFCPIQELDSEEDSGSDTSRELDYETPPTSTPTSSTQSPMHGVSVASSGVQSFAASAGAKREGGERARAKTNRGVRLQRGKYLGKKVVHIHVVVCSESLYLVPKFAQCAYTNIVHVHTHTHSLSLSLSLYDISSMYCTHCVMHTQVRVQLVGILYALPWISTRGSSW